MLIRTPTASASSAMATALAPPAVCAAAAAPWRAQFLEQVSKMAMPLCAVSTLHPGDGATSATPRVRSCVCRGLWGSLPANDRNPAPRNPDVYESDLPVFTTDARMAKAWEIAASAPAGMTSGGSGGGGPVEAVWWASESGTQWRIRGTAWVLGPDVDGPAGAAARTAIQKHMRRRRRTAATAAAGSDAEEEDAWSWSAEVTAHFGNLSPGMRGSFRNPAPGTRRPRRGEPGNTQPGEGLDAPVANEDLDVDDGEARAHFRVVVIMPEEVDQVDLSKGDDPRRWLYTLVGEGGAAAAAAAAAVEEEEGERINGWTKQEVWP